MEAQEIAEKLLIPIWRGADPAYKAKYAMNIWGQFEDAVRSAAYTSSLSKFFNIICSRFSGGVNILARYMDSINEVLQSGQDDQILDTLRNEALTCILHVRIENERRQAEWKAQQAADEAALNQWLGEKPEIS